MFDVNEIRKDFPILQRQINGRQLVYLDNAATTQLPEPVMQALCEHYHYANANVHRGIHTLSNESTKRLEESRNSVALYVGASSSTDIIFTSGTTDSLNIAAFSLGLLLKPGDEIVTTIMEHHSNFVPWQMLAQRTNTVLKVCPLLPNGDLDLAALSKLVGSRTKIVACAQVSNVLGTVNPIKKIADIAHSVGAVMVCDGAQGIRHGHVNVSELDCDMYAFSGHKMMAPTGIGVLYIREELRQKLQPVKFGGGMVDTVTVEKTTFEAFPFSYEAGTPNYPGAYALGCSMRYLEQLGREETAAYEKVLLDKAVNGLKCLDRVHVLGEPENRAGCVSFYVDGAHPYDLAVLLDKLGIAVRSGTHCAQPLLQSYGLEHTVRVSPAFYNTEEEIDYFLEKLEFVLGLL